MHAFLIRSIRNLAFFLSLGTAISIPLYAFPPSQFSIFIFCAKTQFYKWYVKSVRFALKQQIILFIPTLEGKAANQGGGTRGSCGQTHRLNFYLCCITGQRNTLTGKSYPSLFL